MERTLGTISAVITSVKTQSVCAGTSYAVWKKVPAQMEEDQRQAAVREEKLWIT